MFFQPGYRVRPNPEGAEKRSKPRTLRLFSSRHILACDGPMCYDEIVKPFPPPNPFQENHP